MEDSVELSRKGQRKQVPLPVLIAAGVCLLIFVSYLGYQNFGPPQPAPMDEQGRKNQEFIVSMIKKSGGQYDKLSAEDKAALDKLTSGRGGMAYYGVKKMRNIP